MFAKSAGAVISKPTVAPRIAAKNASAAKKRNARRAMATAAMNANCVAEWALSMIGAKSEIPDVCVSLECGQGDERE